MTAPEPFFVSPFMFAKVQTLHFPFLVFHIFTSNEVLYERLRITG